MSSRNCGFIAVRSGRPLVEEVRAVVHACQSRESLRGVVATEECGMRWPRTSFGRRSQDWELHNVDVSTIMTPDSWGFPLPAECASNIFCMTNPSSDLPLEIFEDVTRVFEQLGLRIAATLNVRITAAKGVEQLCQSPGGRTQWYNVESLENIVHSRVFPRHNSA